MLITSSTLSNFRDEFNTGFNKAYIGATPQWPKLGMRIPSKGKSTIYEWLENFSAIREWVGERYVADVKESGYELVNKDWEKTIGLKRNDVLDDNYGTFPLTIRQTALEFAYFPDKRFAALLNTGFSSGKGFDSVAFFSESHPWQNATNAAKTFSNLSNLALTAENYETVMGLFMDTLGSGNVAYGNVEDVTLVVPPKLRSVARRIVEAEYDEVGASNVNKNTAKVAVLPGLTSAKAWFLLATSGEVKPLVFQERQGVEFTAHDQPTDESVFRYNRLEYGWAARYAFGYSLPQLAFGCTG